MKEIHQQAFVIPVGQSVQSKNVLLRVPSDSDFTIMSSMGIKRQELQEGKRTQRLMMAVVPEFDVDAGNNYLMSSFVPNVSSLLLGSSDFEPAQTFEPQVNTPALFAFAIIAVVFSLLQFRINSVSSAATKREEALVFLRQVKAEQLDLASSIKSKSSSSGEGGSGSGTSELLSNNNTMNDKVNKAIEAYKDALQEELNLRTVLPGVRIAAPNDAIKREEDIAAAKQFLNWDIAADLEDDESIDSSANQNQKQTETEESKKTSLLMQSRRRFDNQDSGKVSSSAEDKPMSNVAKAVLLTVAMSQIALLVLLSMDPMSTNSIFTDIAGTPPVNIPLSSWSK